MVIRLSLRGTVAVAVAFTLAAPTAGARALSFSAPVQIAGPPYEAAHTLSALNCPSTSLCVMGDTAGNILTATDPSGGATAWKVAEQVSPDARITAVSCASATFCVAAAADGMLIHSRDPTGGPPTWRRTPGVLPVGDALTSLSCPTARLCVGVDTRGAVVSSRNPTGSARTWRTVRVLRRATDRLTSVACPSVSVCVAVDARVQSVWHSTDPTGSRTAWHATALHTHAKHAYGATVSCASPRLCVIVGIRESTHLANSDTPFIATSTRPTGPSSAWRVENLHLRGGDDLSVLTVSCPVTTFCAVGGGTGAVETTIATSTRPSGGAGSYHQSLYDQDDDREPALLGLSCASAEQCVVAGVGGQVGVSTHPASRALTNWPASEVDGYNSLASVACPSVTECLAGGAADTLEVSADPTAGAGAWTATALPTTSLGTPPVAVDRVSCAAANLCVVGDADGDLAATTTPLTGGFIAAHTSGDLADGGSIAVLSCVAGPFCIAGASEVQDDADLQGTSSLTTVNPTGGTGAWGYDEWIEGGINGGGRPAAGALRSLACASPTLCVAGDAKGGILTNLTPTSVSGWRYAQPDGAASINALTCPSTKLCVAVDSRGRVLHSTDPTSGVWTSATIDTGVPLTAVSCFSGELCVAVDGEGHAFESSQPTGTARAWRRISGIDRDLTSIACPASNLCVAVDSRGAEVTATH